MTRPPDHDHEAGDVPDLESMMEMIDRSGYRDLVADVAGRRRRMFEALANSEDPMWREIGTQLRDGQIGLKDVLHVAAYREKVQHDFEANQEKFREAVADAREQLEQQQAEHREHDR